MINNFNKIKLFTCIFSLHPTLLSVYIRINKFIEDGGPYYMSFNLASVLVGELQLYEPLLL